MRPPADLDDVQWHTLTHAYGTAEDVPALIRALYEGEEAAEEAVHELFGNIHHQGSVYEASAPAVPFLAHAVRHAPDQRADVLMLLATLADHTPRDLDSPHWSGSSTEAICAELCTVLPDLLPCLGDDDQYVRQAALRAVAVVAHLLPADLREQTEALLDALYADDPIPAVRADALTALDHFGRKPEGLDHPAPEVRLTAAILLAEHSGPPYAPELVEVFAEIPPDPEEESLPWPDGAAQDQRLTDVLTRDPDAALTIAARWIAAGDTETHGSWLAEEIAETWREREPEVVALLLAALPHHTDDLSARLRAIGHWSRLLPEPTPELRDTLHRFATTDDDTAGPALLALVHTRDPRCLDLVERRPTPALLDAAAQYFPDAAVRLVPLIRRELAGGATGNDAIALVGALTPLGDAAREAHPELVDCLRTGRAAIIAARALGRLGIHSPETAALLRDAMGGSDTSLSVSAAVAHYELSGDAVPVLDIITARLMADGRTHWYLRALRPLGGAAVPLLPVVEPLLESQDAWTRLAAAEVHHWATGASDRAVPVLAALVEATPVGLEALRALVGVGGCPDELRATLRELSSSSRRLLGNPHADEELRALGLALLEVGAG